ncbi:hypothetical protein [Nocardioides sp. Soil805]|uniref:hypothetical protein n=1 Tax=Nocardioides sp. Soil805 TaxID=1736416 RepID=UPI00070384C7|nr:hypothetical protein [Nocardioides sp. Soil805]KRF34265.1 hypothetical protein ASG94_16225 [Nocardioides sp. Soil805]
MTVAPLRQAALPTARAIRWVPLVGVSALVLLVLLVARTSQRPVDLVLAVASAALACAVVGALHDPAALLLAAAPVSVMRRRLLRLTLVLLPALVVWGVLASVSHASPGATSPGPLLALAAAGVAVAVWTPAEPGVLVGASVPVVWFALDMTVPGSGLLSDAAGWWRTAPQAVVAVALVALLAGRRR